LVTYTKPALPPQLAGGVGPLAVASFGPINAVNNLVIDCNAFDITKFDFSLAFDKVCAPTHVTYTVTYYILSHYVNSINYNPDNITILTQLG
jgi:hypothetical protein